MISRSKKKTVSEVAHRKYSQAELLVSSARPCCQGQAWGQTTFQGRGAQGASVQAEPAVRGRHRTKRPSPPALEGLDQLLDRPVCKKPACGLLGKLCV